jgi:ADP-ribose pyrophosphatase YjhB (NUDIX family)
VIAVAAVIALIIAGLAVSFKKGYITIETVQEEEQQVEKTLHEETHSLDFAAEAPKLPQRYFPIENPMNLTQATAGAIKEYAVDKMDINCSVIVEGLCVKDEKVLLLKRNLEPFRGYWHAVSGRVNEKETLEKGLQRIFKEQTNLDVAVGRIIGRHIEESSDGTTITFAFEVLSVESGEIMLTSENSDYRWFAQFPVNSIYDYSKYFKKVA